MLETFIIFIVVLVVLIIIHEAGHFFAAKFFKIEALKFAIGFGRELFGFTLKETRYSFNMIPLGGYVNLLGEQGCKDITLENLDRAFCSRPIWTRFIVLASGPIANFLLGFLFLLGLFLIVGIPYKDISAKIDQISLNSPASEAGLLVGDSIIGIDGVTIDDWYKMTSLIRQSNGQEMFFTISRDGDVKYLTIAPEKIFIEATGDLTLDYKIGILKTSFRSFKPVSNVTGAVFEAGKVSIEFSIGIVKGILQLLLGTASIEEVGGPVTIAKMTGNNYNLGFSHLVYLAAMLSINLGLINLLPIPMLDGGHLAALGIEKIRKGKPLPSKVVFWGNLTGQIILAVIFYTVVFNDIVGMLR